MNNYSNKFVILRFRKKIFYKIIKNKHNKINLIGRNGGGYVGGYVADTSILAPARIIKIRFSPRPSPSSVKSDFSH